MEAEYRSSGDRRSSSDGPGSDGPGAPPVREGSVDELMRSVLAKKSDLFDEYARRSHAKESDSAATNAAGDGGVAPTEQDFVRAEQERLGLRAEG